ncbi:MAG: SprT-like domain-containing protein [Gammaproteobacteria bacterium]
MLTLEQAFPAALAAAAREWFALWQLHPLADDVRVRYSQRMFRCVGRCMPARRVVSLAAGVREMPDPLIEEIAVHEFAHIAAFEHHGPAIRPHGCEWRALMQAAGFEPRVRFENMAAINLVHARASGGKRYVHRCVACGSSRVSTRRMTRWRCGAC